MLKTENAPRSDSVRLEEMLSKICGQYCRYPGQMLTQEELDARCARCPSREIVAYVDELRGKFDC